MSQFESSIVIPVYNKWELTRNCLKSIAATTDRERVEVIVVDNASTDATSQGCPFLGKQLFGDAFRYIRNEQNRNFAGASNQGAKAARGEFIVFLNNDTEVQPGWYQPLLDDFQAFADIAATGPILLYPEETPLGRTIQHLGVTMSPGCNPRHLYEGIPAGSPLTRKRRFFQAITAACLVIRKALFVETGGFDEKYVNGFEDVDLCLRLREMGYRLTVNPDTTVIHHESQSPGRHDQEEKNANLLTEKCAHLLKPDWDVFARDDGLFLGLTEWALYQPMLPKKIEDRLNPLLTKIDLSALKEMLKAYPFWEKGWRRALELATDIDEKCAFFQLFFKLFRNPQNAHAAYAMGKMAKNRSLMDQGAAFMRGFLDAPDTFLKHAEIAEKWCHKIGLEDLARQHAAWRMDYEHFRQSTYREYARNFVELARDRKAELNPLSEEDYNIWWYGKDELPVPDMPQAAPVAAFSILMPVYNPKPEYFRAALDSVLAQTWSEWELCLADDASTDPQTGRIIAEYCVKDSRIKATRREQNGNIAAATNTALEMAGNAWSVFMDQDDLLEKDALSVMARAIADKPNGLLFYSDEDKIEDFGHFSSPYFKNGRWDRELLAAQNFVCHLAAYNTERLRAIGGLRAGFDGAQDHDLILRYTKELDNGAIVHIPAILYHWRIHGQSTASNIAAKGHAMENSRRAIQDWLDHVSPGALARLIPGRQWPRIHYPLPAERPLASIIIEIPDDGFDVEAHVAAISGKTRYPHEMVYVCREQDRKFWENYFGTLADKYPQASLVVAESLQDAANAANGEILGFISANIKEFSPYWLEELVSSLWRPHVGAVGGALINTENDTHVHAGLMYDGSYQLKPLFSGASANFRRWFAWNDLARTVDALDGNCLFTRAEIFKKHGGLDTVMGNCAMQDYCLRLGLSGLAAIWWPFAKLGLNGQPRLSLRGRDFEARWQKALKPFNPHVGISGENLSICVDRASPLEFRADEYLRLYPDIATAGIDPALHYSLVGKREGRKGRLSHIDYSGLTRKRISQWKKTPKTGIVVCTALCGDYERLLPPAYLNDGWEYVCYSDQPRESWGIWDIRQIPYANDDPRRRARWVKTNLPGLFPDADWVIWMDANIVITGDMEPLLRGRGNGTLFLADHVTRNCIYEEGQACITAKKDAPDVLLRQLARYREEGFPAKSGLFETGVMVLRPKDVAVQRVFACWDEEIRNNSKRDQISLPYVLFKNKFNPGRLFGDIRKIQNHRAYEFLTHAETGWIQAPEIS